MAHFQGFVTTICLLFLYLLLIIFLPAAFAEIPYQLCASNSTTYANDGPFQNNLNNLLQSLSSNASDSKFYNTSFGNDPDEVVYGLYMCLNYVENETCKNCITTASQSIIALCHNIKEAVIYGEVCQLRYSDRNFFGQLDVSNNTGQHNPKTISDPEMFKSVVNETLHNLTEVVVSNLSANMYAVGEVPYTNGNRTISALVQCTRDLSAGDCGKCLRTAIEDVLDKYYFYMGARMFSRSCFLRYELYKFYIVSEPHDRKGEQDRGGKMWKIAILGVLALAAMVLLGSCVSFYAVNKRKRRIEDEILGQPMFHNQNFQTGYVSRKAQELPYLDLASIHAATSNFSDSNKLGEGGFGPVYKGILSDGREVAVKRLSCCSEQGTVEFTNEVHLIMRLQHKNLVRLLGFCIDGQEKILVYEYMQNSSLDVILFDSKKRAILDWSKRLDIISGIARGMLYLHEDSRLKIIHRDLKASNILLDSNMNPKISDFGMARIFAGNEGQANTATIVGTYGYMAPEYAMEGLYSVKSDVYSYGVLLLEIIAGRRNGGFHRTQNAPDLLAYAWQLWNEGRGLELIDPLLMVDSYEVDEFQSYLHIGLLCVQEDAYDRPNMSDIVTMLKSESTALCQPKRPAFFMGRFVEKSGVSNDKSSSANGLTVSIVQPR